MFVQLALSAPVSWTNFPMPLRRRDGRQRQGQSAYIRDWVNYRVSTLWDWYIPLLCLDIVDVPSFTNCYPAPGNVGLLVAGFLSRIVLDTPWLRWFLSLTSVCTIVDCSHSCKNSCTKACNLCNQCSKSVSNLMPFVNIISEYVWIRHWLPPLSASNQQTFVQRSVL